nr:uncharacterized protein LOC129452839 [Misgurnus anguillicaudatus]
MFHRFLICLFMWHLTGVFGDNVIIEMEGNYVILRTHTNIQRNDEIEWRFVTQGFNSRIARLYKAANIISIYDDVLDGRFRDRLQVDNQTGDLTITNITTQHTGSYQMNITGRHYIKETLSRYYVIVHAPLAAPIIYSYCPQNPSSSKTSSVSKCVLFCSVLNIRDVGDVSLSWYKGNSLLSSISVSKPFNIILPLEVEYQDTNTYSCVLNNTITNQTQHFNRCGCQSCSDSVNSCAKTEAVIRLVVSALVGVAAVAVLF